MPFASTRAGRVFYAQRGSGPPVVGLWRSFGTPAFDLRAEADRISAPVLLVWGTRDIILPLAAGWQTNAAIPGSRLRTLGTGHVVFASDPEGFLAVARPFIDFASQAAAGRAGR